MIPQTTLSNDCGVILGGGGVLGLAWEIGILAGLDDAGADLRSVREVIGTSAGSFAAVAWLGHATMDEPYRRQVDNAVTEVGASVSPQLSELYKSAFERAAGDAAFAARLLGEVARNATTIDPGTRFAVVRDRLGMDKWPDPRLTMTAIDADTGELVELRHDSGLALIEAAAASGAVAGVWPKVEAAGRTWIDGGMVSGTNAALASRFRLAVVIAPVPRNLTGLTVQNEIADLPSDTEVFLIIPDEESIEAIGANPLDQSQRRAAAEAGRRQGRNVVGPQLKKWLAANDFVRAAPMNG